MCGAKCEMLANRKKGRKEFQLEAWNLFQMTSDGATRFHVTEPLNSVAYKFSQRRRSLSFKILNKLWVFKTIPGGQKGSKGHVSTIYKRFYFICWANRRCICCAAPVSKISYVAFSIFSSKLIYFFVIFRRAALVLLWTPHNYLKRPEWHLC